MAEADSSSYIPIDKKLGDIFKEAFDFFLRINESNEPSNSLEFQLQIKKHIGNFEDATRLVSLAGLFSDNEAFEEIPTGDIKYLLLPFFLAQLTLKLTSTDGDIRKNYVEVAEVYYKDFLKRCGVYGLTGATTDMVRHPGDNPRNPNELEELKQMALQRNDKLRKYKEKKELEEKIAKMKVAVEREEELDDDVLRDFYMNLIKLSIMEAEEELNFLDQEKQILDFRRQQGSGSGSADDAENGAAHGHHKHPHHHHRKPLKPIIITRDALQKAVYGRGYPSLPTMTVEEFYHQRVAEGIFPDPDKKPDPSVKARQDMTEDEVAELDEQEDIALEEAIERDDEYQRARQAAMDEFKDNVRRGDGNRYNRS